MRKWNYILILFFISAAYLFSQNEINGKSEGNDQIQKTDTVIVVRVDTVIVKEFVSQPEEKIRDYYFYDNNFSRLQTSGHSTVKNYTMKSSGMISAKTGAGFFRGSVSVAKKHERQNTNTGISRHDKKNKNRVSAGAEAGILDLSNSFALDIPISSRFNISLKYIHTEIRDTENLFFYASAGELATIHDAVGNAGTASTRLSAYGLGFGHIVTRTNSFILKSNFYICANLFPNQERMFNKNGFGINVGSDLLFKVFDPCYISVSPEMFILPGTNSGTAFAVVTGGFSLGMSIVY